MCLSDFLSVMFRLSDFFLIPSSFYDKLYEWVIDADRYLDKKLSVFDELGR